MQIQLEEMSDEVVAREAAFAKARVDAVIEDVRAELDSRVARDLQSLRAHFGLPASGTAAAGAKGGPR